MTAAYYTPRDLAVQTLDGTLPYEETWRENAKNVLSLLREIEQLRGERILTDSPKVRDLGNRVLEALTIMRDDDEDEDEDGWILPDLRTISVAMSANSALVQQAEDRHRFKVALQRISNEWTDQSASSDDVREFARSVLAGPDPVRDEDKPNLCDICSLGFHTHDYYANATCGCRKYGCGCRAKREQLKEAA